jgi:phosphoglycolate phosphatase
MMIFDFDGTIADTFAHTMKITNILSDEFKFKKVHDHEIEVLKGKTIQEIIKHLNVPVLKIPNIVAKARTELLKDIESIEPIEGLKQILPLIKQANVQMGILTTNSRENVERFLKVNSMEIFDFIHSTSRVWGKNHGLRKLMQQNQLTAEDLLYVGDETRDIEAAKKEGIKVIAVTWGYNSHAILETFSPDFIAHTPDELFNIFVRHVWPGLTF